MQALTPYEIFGLPVRFEVDMAALEQAHREALMKVHPDRFAARPAHERRVAEQWSARINEAFDTLKNPVRRAAWLCENAGHAVNAETNTAMPMDFLMEQMAWREALEQADSAPAVESVLQTAQRYRQQTLEALTQTIDASPNWAQAVEWTRKLMFVEKFLVEIDRRLHSYC